MATPRIYLPVSLHPNHCVLLQESALHHIRVLRLKSGAPLILFNGEGGEYLAVLETVERRQARVRVQTFQSRELESSLQITLIQGISKGERMDYTLQKAVELGVQQIQPLLTARSVVNLNAERQQKRLQHWRGVVIGACEQCGRNRLPSVLAPLTFASWLTICRDQASGLLLDPTATQGLRNLSALSHTINLLIGPEGGLTDAEISQATAAGFVPIRLGPRILRTETAGVAAIAALQTLWGDLG